MIHLGAVHAARLQVHGKPRKHAIHFFPVRVSTHTGCAKFSASNTPFGAAWGQPLDAQIAITGYRTDDITRLIHSRGDQAMRFSAANSTQTFPRLSVFGENSFKSRVSSFESSCSYPETAGVSFGFAGLFALCAKETLAVTIQKQQGEDYPDEPLHF